MKEWSSNAVQWQKSEYYENQGKKKEFINRRKEFIESENKRSLENAS